MNYLKTGVSFNFKYIKEQHPYLWDLYKEHFEGIDIENEEKVYFNYLADKVEGRVLFNFLNDCLPEELRKNLEK